MNKAEFIKEISNLSREDINKFIQSKGKKARKRKLFIRVRNS